MKNQIFSKILSLIIAARNNRIGGEFNADKYKIRFKKDGFVIIEFKNIPCEIAGKNSVWIIKINEEEKIRNCIEKALKECEKIWQELEK